MLIIKIAFVLLAYLIGSIPFGYIIGKIKGVDVRKVGSKNIGATNTARALGKKYFALTFLLDMSKGALLVALFRYNIIDAKYCLLNPMIYGLAACLGHSFPIFLKFKGGKCVSCGCGCASAYCPLLLLVAIITFVVTLLITKMVSIGSLIGATSVFIGALIISLVTKDFNLNISTYPIDSFWPYNYLFVLITFIIVILIWVKHKSNIQRILAGTENKIKK